MKKVLYAGSFDPLTYGHMNVIGQAGALFDEVIIAIMRNSSKKESFFTPQERLELIKEIYKDHKNIKVITASGATIDVAEQEKAQALLRGLRSVTDFEYELQIAAINRELSNKEITTICLFPDHQFEHISSSIVKEIFSLDKDITNYVPPQVKEKMLKKSRNETKSFR